MSLPALAGTPPAPEPTLFGTEAVEVAGNALCLRLPGGTVPLRDAAGRPVRIPRDGAGPEVLRFAHGFGVLPAAAPDGGRSTLLLDGTTVLGALRRFAEDRPDAIRARVGAGLRPVLLGLLADPPRPGAAEAAGRLSALDPKVLARLLALLPAPGRGTPPAGLRPWPDTRRLLAPLTAFPAACTGTPVLPPPLQAGGRVVAARHLPVPHRRGLMALTVAWEEPDLVWIAGQGRFGKPRSGFVYLPEADACPPGSAAPPTDLLAGAVGALHAALLRCAVAGLPFRPGPEAPPGLIVTGLRHIGHAIWEEMQAIDQPLSQRARWTTSPVFYVLREASGIPLFGDPAELYPEIADAFRPVAQVSEAVDHALAQGVQMHLARGRRVRRATRERLAAFASRHGAATGLAAQAEALLGTGAARLPCLVLGLRLTSRAPEDFAGLLERLSRHLVAALGPMVVVVDGMNADPDTGRAATQVFNGVVKAMDGNAAMQAEQDFCAAYAAAVADLPVRVVNCIGMSIRENLFWLSQADFFVAPNGAGVAKLRWALDVPGLVLTSRVNLEHCRFVGIYADEHEMEPPFTRMELTRPEEVRDTPPDPPRAAPPVSTTIPYPDRFVVDEAKVFPRILDLFREALATRGR